ncbi:MAG: hypothetical protein ED557_01410 [Balneola sp.]|nr:MAG: hypothetical protein ED557_01410 [Balneola sp.]
MKNLTFPKFLSFFGVALFYLFISHSTLIASETPSTDKILFEISDKFNEVRLGITETSIYMVVSERVRDIANKNFQDQNSIEENNFKDSEGNFISSYTTYLESNKIEYSHDEIIEVKFLNGKLSFNYLNTPEIGFEDIFSTNGIKALNNFYVEDLEAFILAYHDL